MTESFSRVGILASELCRFAGWYFLTHCPRCGRPPEIIIDVLIKRCGGDLAMHTATVPAIRRGTVPLPMVVTGTTMTC